MSFTTNRNISTAQLEYFKIDIKQVGVKSYPHYIHTDTHTHTNRIRKYDFFSGGDRSYK